MSTQQRSQQSQRCTEHAIIVAANRASSHTELRAQGKAFGSRPHAEVGQTPFLVFLPGLRQTGLSSHPQC